MSDLQKNKKMRDVTWKKEFNLGSVKDRGKIISFTPINNVLVLQMDHADISV
jgi:hypothetical protein